jgi:HSP20 family molecular chaperone IbpA
MRVAKLAPMPGKIEEIERLFDRFLAPGLLAEPFIPPFPYETAGAEWYPTLDITETAEEFIVRLEVAGVHKENLDINLTGTLLKVLDQPRPHHSDTGVTCWGGVRLHLLLL